MGRPLPRATTVVGRHKPGEEGAAVGLCTLGERRWRSDGRRGDSVVGGKRPGPAAEASLSLNGGKAWDDLSLGPWRWWGGTGWERRCPCPDLARRGRGGGGATGGGRRRGPRTDVASRAVTAGTAQPALGRTKAAGTTRPAEETTAQGGGDDGTQ
jgi:hypothetical protein